MSEENVQHNDESQLRSLIERVEAVAEAADNGEVYSPSIDWVETQIMNRGRDNEYVKPLVILENFMVLMKYLEVDINYNEMSKEQVVSISTKHKVEFHEDSKNNAVLTWVHNMCKKNMLTVTIDELMRYMDFIANQNSIHPVKQWIEAKPWDGVSRIGELCKTIKSDTFMKDRLIVKWLISCIAALYLPNGVRAQGILVFFSPQGKGKTTWFIKMGGGQEDFVKDGVALNVNNKDSVKEVISHWICELGELSSTFKKADINDLKSFTGLDKDSFRAAFARKSEGYKRRTIFCGSVDEMEFLADDNGNRRFWVIDVKHIIDHNLDMQQIWAEVKELYEDGFSYVLSQAEIAELDVANQEFKTVDPIVEMLDEEIKKGFNDDGGQWVNCTEIAKRIGLQRITKRETNTIGRYLRKYEYKCNKMKHKYLVSFKTQNRESY